MAIPRIYPSLFFSSGARVRPAHRAVIIRDSLSEGFSHSRCLHDLLRLLPAGAVAGWDLHPLESAALSRRTPEADSPINPAWRRRASLPSPISPSRRP